MDCALSPVQQRNLEKAWNAKVLDRTGLILEIFGRRARTREGALQVELAHLTYQKSRLVRSWTHLERQRGGFGFLGGPGETQIEADRRLIEERIARIEAELEKVKRTRKLHRDSRKRVPYPIVALVGYTNAGKSTLFNRLTAASVLSADMLFATLDPTLRAIDLPHGNRVILSDTVGFISDLPTMLVAAFRATLEEVIEADVILHVRDISHDDTDAQSHDVGEGAGRARHRRRRDRRLIEVWNKIDRLDARTRARSSTIWRSGSRRNARPVLVSALTGEGLDALIAAIEARLARSAPDARSGARSGRRRGHELALSPRRGAGKATCGDDGRLARHRAGRSPTRRRRCGRSSATHRRMAGSRFLVSVFSGRFRLRSRARPSRRASRLCGVLPRAASARSIEREAAFEFGVGRAQARLPDRRRDGGRG